MTTIEIDKIKEKLSELNLDGDVRPYSDIATYFDGWFTLAELKLVVETIEKKGE